MFRNNNLEPEEQKTDVSVVLENTNYIWNVFSKDVLNDFKTISVDYNDINMLKEMTKEKMLKIFEQYKKKWLVENIRYENPIDIFRIILRNFNIKSMDELMRNDDLEKRIQQSNRDLNNVMNCIMYMNHFKDEYDEENIITDEEYEEIRKIFRKMKEVLYNCNYTLVLMSNVINANDINYENNDNLLLKFKVAKYSEDDDNKKDKERDHQKLLRMLLEICKIRRYTKYKDSIYQPKYTKKDNHFTLSYEKVVEIDQFVYEQTSRDNNPSLWDLATKGQGNIGFVQDHLKNCVDSSLPQLVKERYLFSFNNGIYKLFEEVEEGKYTDKFYPYDGDERPELKNGMVCNKYFNQDFDITEVEDWYDIPTPNIQKILDLQYKNTHEKEYEQICRWMYIFMGRLLYKIGELDEWQVIAFMKGLAGTGKGTITKTVQWFYEPEDVGTLGNDSEKLFGLSALYDKLLFVAPEIKEDISLPQASFQSMISGEDVSIAIKHKKAESVQWEVPGILAGNEVPNWTDNSGSIARRLIIFAFNKKVPKSQLDPFLSKKIQKNITNILKKCNLAYLEAVNNHSKKNIWRVLPSYFKFRQEELSEQTNELKKFLKTSKIEYGRNLYVSENELRDNFMEYLKTIRKNYNYSRDKLNEPFQTLEEEYDTEIKLVKIDRRLKKFKDLKDDCYGNRSGWWIMGMTIKDEDTGEIPEDENFVKFLKYVDSL